MSALNKSNCVWQPLAVDQIKKLTRCMATHTGQGVEESTAHLFTRLSTVLVRGDGAEQDPHLPLPRDRGHGVKPHTAQLNWLINP